MLDRLCGAENKKKMATLRFVWKTDVARVHATRIDSR